MGSPALPKAQRKRSEGAAITVKTIADELIDRWMVGVGMGSQGLPWQEAIFGARGRTQRERGGREEGKKPTGATQLTPNLDHQTMLRLARPETIWDAYYKDLYSQRIQYCSMGL